MGKLTEIWERWCDTTTFHGFNELGYLKKLNFRSLVWVFLILGATTATIVEIARVFADFRRSPTAVHIREVGRPVLSIPNLVICTAAKLNVKKLLRDGASLNLVNGLLLTAENPMAFATTFHDLKHHVPRWIEEYNNFTASKVISSTRDFYTRYSVPCQELLPFCKTHYGDINCCEKAELLLDYQYISCYRLIGLGNQSWQGNTAGIVLYVKTSINDGIGEVSADLTRGIAVQITNHSFPYEFTNHFVPENTLASISLQPEYTTRINTFKQSCLPLQTYMDKQNNFLDSTSSGCIWRSWALAFVEHCKCIPWSFIESTGAFKGYKYCNPFGYLTCFKLNSTMFGIIEKTRNELEKECFLPMCQNWNYNPTVSFQRINQRAFSQYKRPTLTNGTYSVVEVYYSQMSYKHIKEIYVYTPDSFISNIGGQIGLWMGCSVLTVFQGLNYLLDAAIVALNRMRKGYLSAYPDISQNSQIYGIRSAGGIPKVV